MGLLQTAPRLGLVEARIQHADRHALLYLSAAQIFVESGDVKIRSAGTPEVPAGLYGLPYQTLSMLLLGPGTSISHDALRIMARHGTGVIAVGSDGVRCYSAPPWGATRSAFARQHARIWADEKTRLEVARRMYAIRFGEVLPHRDIAVLRGIEGGRVKRAYEVIAGEFGIKWNGRHYDRAAPDKSDLPNQAINFCVSCVESAAEIAVYATGAIPALGFIHEDSATSFTLDIADLYRAELTITLAFKSVKEYLDSGKKLELERVCRINCAKKFNRDKTISKMIDRIQLILADEKNAVNRTDPKQPTAASKGIRSVPDGGASP